LDENYRYNKVIGIQLRNEFLNGMNDTRKFLDCAINLENEFMLRNKSLNSSLFKWFIASDSQNLINEIEKNYPNKSFSTNKFKLGHIKMDRQAYYRAILDVELLSHCDELIVTGGSTFGWLSAMKMVKLPLYVNGRTPSMTTCQRSTLNYPPARVPGYGSFKKKR
jgi:hypothetical protein